MRAPVCRSSAPVTVSRLGGPNSLGLTVNVLLNVPHVRVCLVSAVIASADDVNSITASNKLPIVTVEITGVPVIEQIGNTVPAGSGDAVRVLTGLLPTVSSETLKEMSTG